MVKRIVAAWKTSDYFEPLALTGLFICVLVGFLLFMLVLVQLP